MDEETRKTRVEIPPKFSQSRRRVLYRVPLQVREVTKHIYDAVVVSLGPYHHGRDPQLLLAEQLKNELLDQVCIPANKGFLLSKISERMDDIRHFYRGADGYGDQELAEMMLRDACFLLCYMEGGEKLNLICNRLGMSGAMFMYRDMLMLENQVPLWLINLLISLLYQGQPLLCNYLSGAVFGDQRMTRLPWQNGDHQEEEEEPLHLLAAVRRTYLVKKDIEDSRKILLLINDTMKLKEDSSKSNWRMVNCPFRSVTDLKAKGIYFKPASHYLTDIRFSSYAFYGELHLPVFHVTYSSVIFFSNAIAFEMSPEAAGTDFGVTSYINFMKTLIDTAKDVKVLREKGILYSLLASDEEVAFAFKVIDTSGFSNRGLFHDVKMRIEEHCNSKARTWMADLINTNFRSPWTVLTLAAAILLLCLTFLQTYFTINPRK